MNYSERPHPATGARRPLRGLILLLPLALITEMQAISGIRVVVQEDVVYSRHSGRPYLSALGPAPLRFAAAPALPDSAPSTSEATLPDSTTATESQNSVVELPAPPIAEPPPGPATTPENLPEPTPVPAAKEPPGILLDELRPAIRPEDFLPYFQFPGGKKTGELTVIVPVPPTAPASTPLPPSSATYTRTPK